MGRIPLDYADQEKGLGVIVTSNLAWNEQCSKVLSKANQKLGMARRNCYFVQDENRRRVLYLTLVWSQFEHCSVIWRPVTKSQINNNNNNFIINSKKNISIISKKKKQNIQ